MDLVLRTVFVFFLILLITRAVGRRELSSMEPFDLILLVVIGDLVQQGVTQSDYSLTGATMVIVTVALLTVATAWLSFRVRRLRPILEGDPIILVADGRMLERNLRRQRMTVEELGAEARLAQIGSLADVRYAVLETNGKISFLTRVVRLTLAALRGANSDRVRVVAGRRVHARARVSRATSERVGLDREAERPDRAGALPPLGDAVRPSTQAGRSRTTSRADLSSRRPR